MIKTTVDKKQDSTLNVIIVLDHSGSMDDIRRSTISAFNAFLDKQRKEPGADTTFVALFLFADNVERVWKKISVERIPDLSRENYRPNGQTALLDAIGMAITDTERRLLRGDVIFVCLTDGMENHSHTYDFMSIRNLIRQKIDKKWEFIWLGSSEHSREFALGLGLSPENIELFQVTDEGIRESCDKISRGVSLMRQFKNTNGWKDLSPRQ